MVIHVFCMIMNLETRPREIKFGNNLLVTIKQTRAWDGETYFTHEVGEIEKGVVVTALAISQSEDGSIYCEFVRKDGQKARGYIPRDAFFGKDSTKEPTWVATVTLSGEPTWRPSVTPSGEPTWVTTVTPSGLPTWEPTVNLYGEPSPTI